MAEIVARGRVVETQGDSHFVLRHGTSPSEEMFETPRGVLVAPGMLIDIYEDGSISIVDQPPEEPASITLPSGVADAEEAHT